MTELQKALSDARRLVARLEGITAAGVTIDKPTRLYGTREVAEQIGVEAKTISGYVSRGQMPEPYARLASGPVWTEEQIKAWEGVREA